ncbi:site-specific DNA-methyltransferase [Peribacillus saganii]|uniref:Site-specific DNA-methyltransferase n=1 Tax=Peribacillus saganii TaxID=2303992 RepID=A0A372LQ48_9BACI|nr:site-specific DNA-methyltransferase [Peribacillus saganii]RFU69458.1 site-specific DNA-methyltransferase [Peribacillus saganii]
MLLDKTSLQITEENIKALKKLFPEVESEGKIDFEKLKAILGEEVAPVKERYEFTWHGKKHSLKLSQTPSTGTLRPDRASSKNWDKTENVYIEGDNLEVLKLLQKSYFGKVKMIFIDPPYNTGKDFVYKDNFRDNIRNYKEITEQAAKANPETSGRYHTEWLNMIYPRVKLARNLLTEDGVIFISIDDNELANMIKVCNEIFGEDNFIGNLIIQTATDNNATQINIEHEYMLCFAKSRLAQHNWTSKSEAAQLIMEKYEELKARYTQNTGKIQNQLRSWIRANQELLPKVTHYDNVDKKGVFHDGDIANTKYSGYVYDVIHPVTKKPCKVPEKGFRFPKETMDKLIAAGDIMFGKDETTLIKPKKRIENAKDILRSIIYEDGRASTKTFESLLGRGVFQNPKSDTILARLINFVTDEDSIVLDFFSGSATTAHAVMKLNATDGGSRKFILVQLPEMTDERSEAFKAGYKTICEIGKERILRAGNKIIEDTVTTQLDIGFKVFKLDSSNVKTWDPVRGNLEQTLFDLQDNIKSDRSKEDLLYEILLKIGIPLTAEIEQIHSKAGTIFKVSAGSVLVCLDKEIDMPTVDILIKHKSETLPTKVIFKETGFLSDSVKTNAIQSLKKNGIVDVRSV